MLPYTNRTVNLAKEPILGEHDWILPLDPLPEELKAQYPWNWNWFSDEWWENMLTVNYGMVKHQLRERKTRDEQHSARHTEEFKQVVADKYYSGNISDVSVDILDPPKEKRVREFFNFGNSLKNNLREQKKPQDQEVSETLRNKVKHVN